MLQVIVLQPGGLVVATVVEWARTPWRRGRGLLGRRPLAHGEALVLERARQVHTSGMRYGIDVLFCDARWHIEHVVRGMRPNRITRWVRGARYVVELPAGTLPDELPAGARVEMVHS